MFLVAVLFHQGVSNCCVPSPSPSLKQTDTQMMVMLCRNTAVVSERERDSSGYNTVVFGARVVQVCVERDSSG